MSALLTVIVTTPALGALAVLLSNDTTRARWIATSALSIALACAWVLSWSMLRHGWEPVDCIGATVPWLHARWHLRADGLSVPFLSMTLMVALACIHGAPRRESSVLSLAAILSTASGALGVYLSYDLALLALFWTVAPLPFAVLLRRSTERTTRRVGRARELFVALGVVPVVAVAALVSVARPGSLLPFDLLGTPLPPASQSLPFALLALAVFLRKPVAPFHFWLPALIERGPVSVTGMITTTHLGAFLVARVMIPLMPDAALQWLPLLADVALVASFYTAFVGVSQRDLRRAIGYVTASQLALVVVGIAGMDRESVHGAMLQMFACAPTTVALLLIAEGIHARYATTDARELGGLAQRHPRLTAAYFLFACAAIGIPGSLQFISEDLLLHGLLHRHPVVAVSLIVVTALNGMTLLRLFFEGFLGESRDPSRISPHVGDLLPRELVTLYGLLALVMISGIVPQRLLDARSVVVRAMAIADMPSGHATHDESHH
jgi:NADH-quinone oxidoreductase subunit M